jgi:hypothetical protein
MVMSKPHEEEWSTGEGVLSGALYAGDTWIGSFTNPERARLAKEAPEMARLIRDVMAWDISQRVTPEAPAKSPIPQLIAMLTRLGMMP